MEVKVRFGAGTSESCRYRIIELPDTDLVEDMRNGKSVSIRGEADDESIMIVSSKTFRLRELCTSNTFLLVNNDSGLIEESASSIIEAIPIKGLTEKLTKLLRQCPYEGPRETPDKDLLSLLHVDKLPGLVQANDEEFYNTVAKHHAIILNGHWRIAGPSYICRFFQLFFTSALLEDWSVAYGTVSRTAVINKFTEEFSEEFSDPKILNHVFDTFQDSDFRSENSDDWKVSELLVCRFFADQLLRANQTWKSSEFLMAWHKLVGEFAPNLSMLSGLALLDELPGEEGNYRLIQFSSDDLPTSPADRFNLLFRTRPRWYYDEILPFIQGLEESEKKLQGLILKHGRYSTEAGTGRKIVTALLPPS